MHPSRTLIRRALILLTGVVLLLAVGTPGAGAPAPPPERHQSPVTAATWPVWGVQLERAVTAANLASWYSTAAEHPAPTTSTSVVHAAPVEDLSGDRFDRLAACESGGGNVENIDPAASSADGRYLGAFQFTRTSHLAAGGDGDPRDDSYADQKQTAVTWAGMTDPYSQWPVCWPRSAG